MYLDHNPLINEYITKYPRICKILIGLLLCKGSIIITSKNRILNFQSTGHRSRYVFNSFETTQARTKSIED
jgi:hypothetical protein